MSYHNLRSLLARIIFITLPCLAAAQPTYWTDIREELIPATQEDRLIIPNHYKTFRLQFDQLKVLLATAPPEEQYLTTRKGILVYFPMPDGSYAAFEVWEAPVMAPELTAQYPDIRSFAGKSLDRKGMIARFDISPAGLHVMFLNTGGSTIFIDPYARGNAADYLCYYRKDYVNRDGSVFNCLVDDEVIETPGPSVTDRAGDCGNLRQYRLALACTGEYANFHGSFGANKAPALAAMNTTMTRVNGVYEREFSIRMNIIANDTAIIYTDPATDPYTNSNGSTMLGQNQTTCNNVIGSANYDIGHVFSTGGGGIAQLSCVCSSSSKARGVTGLPSPIGDPFDIDYVSHEIGHQFGGAHTQYNDDCNRSNTSAMEPGSASTIMGYAGVCDPSIQPNSDDYFHARSLFQIMGFATGAGNACAQLTANGNSAPVVPTLTNRNIPNATPFILGGSASDPNGDVLSFCWEQMNAWSSPTQAMPPQPTNASGPVFRSLLPVADGNRYMPNFDAVLNGVTPEWEVLPSVGRTLNFRMTVRDNNPGGGCTTERDMTVSTSGSIGPFQVIVPNGGESYPTGSVQTITWNVAGSNGSPVSCANVNILVSTDGGASFSTLVADTPNDGSQSVTYNVPPTPTARILIQAVGNIFYDVSNNNFEIIASLPVELIAFNATWQNGAVHLDWSTATETDNRGFYIERSAGNTPGFQNIGWIDGRGATSLKQTYHFTDQAVRPGETYYYRLRQTDFSGAFKYSNIRSVTTTGAGGKIALWPNPVRDIVRVQWPDGLQVEDGQLIILNGNGTQVRELSFSAGMDGLDLHALAPGFYLIQTIIDGKIYNGRFLKS